MGLKWGEPWTELLHREQDGDLTPTEQAHLEALAAQPGVVQARHELARVHGALTSLPPARPASPLAGTIASEIAWSARLEPPLPSRSVAAAVAAEVRLGERLVGASVPPPSRELAAEVAAQVWASRLLEQAGGPVLPRSVASGVAAEISGARLLDRPLPPLPASLAAGLALRVAGEVAPPRQPEEVGPVAVPMPTLASAPAPRVHNPAPLLLVSGLLVGLTLLGVTRAWPNLTAGATVVQTLVSQMSPLAGVGLVLLLLASLLVAWRPTPAIQRFGTAAFVLSAVLTLPPLYEGVGRSGVQLGRDMTVHGRVAGNVIAVGANVTLASDAQVQGEVVTLFGDVRRESGARVAGRVNTLLGHALGDETALQTSPPTGMNLATASAFRPLLGWLGGAAWGRVFMLLTGAMLLLLFVVDAAPLLARRQRHAPLRTLALGVLALAVLIGPALGLALTGLLVPSLLVSAFALLLVATGLSVSAYDVGRAAAYRLRLPQPDLTGAMLGLGGVTASLAAPPLALSLALVGGAWGMGTLLLTRPLRDRAPGREEQGQPRD